MICFSYFLILKTRENPSLFLFFLFLPPFSFVVLPCPGGCHADGEWTSCIMWIRWLHPILQKYLKKVEAKPRFLFFKGIKMVNTIRKKLVRRKVRWRKQWEGGRVLAFELEMLQRFTFPFSLHISRAAIPMHSATRGTHFIEFLHAEVSVNLSLNHLVFTTGCGSPRWHQNLGFLHWILYWI